MELVCSELGKKIRSAIRVRLLELGKTVDDELIDYIMVMAANKKEESQMARDLQPFLEEDTVKFTSWLQKVLKKLEQITVTVTDNDYKVANLVNPKKHKSPADATKKKSAVAKEDKKKKSKKESPEGTAKKIKSKVKTSGKTKVVKVKKTIKDELLETVPTASTSGLRTSASLQTEKPAFSPVASTAKAPVMMVRSLIIFKNYFLT